MCYIGKYELKYYMLKLNKIIYISVNTIFSVFQNNRNNPLKKILFSVNKF